MVRGSLHATFENVRHAKLLSDLAEIAVGARSVSHYARATDDFQISYFREVSQNLVLHAVGKEREPFLLTEIFKRKYGDLLVDLARGSARQ